MYKNVSDYLTYTEYWAMDINQVIDLAKEKQDKLNNDIVEKVNYDTSLSWYQGMLNLIVNNNPKNFPKEPPNIKKDSEDKNNTLSFGQSMRALIKEKKQGERS